MNYLISVIKMGNNNRKVKISFGVILAVAVLFSLCSNFPLVNGRPARSMPLLVQRIQTSFPSFELKNQYFDYDYEDYRVQQGPRRRRWAFPVDVQVNCPPGQVLHSSGYGCVPDKDLDDY